MLADEWDYIGEGKVHVAICNAQRGSIYFGYALLVCKGNATIPCVAQRMKFATNVMNMLITNKYVSDKYLGMELSLQFVEDVFRRIQPQRPAKRVAKGSSLLTTATLIRNFGVIYRTIPCSLPVRKDTLVVELKVKGGDIGWAPFITADRSIKLHHSRFKLMQLYKTAVMASATTGTSSVDWGILCGFSEYEPRELCSRDPERVCKSLSLLVGNPQNNLRVSLNGAHVYGWNLNSLDHLHTTLSISEFGQNGGREPTPQLPGPAAVGRMLRVVSAVLCEETALQRLQAAQRLDLLDMEGAALAYTRLCRLYGVQHTREQQQASSVVLSCLAEQMSKPIEPLILDTIHGINLNICSSKTFSLCDMADDGSLSDVQLVHQLAMLRVDSSMSPEQRSRQRCAAQTLLDACSAEQCTLLLQLWMAALVAKDASVIVTLQACTVATEEVAGSSDRTEGTTLHVATQSDAHCGVVTEQTSRPADLNAVEQTFRCVYSVGVIDLGLKALDKVWSKDLDEDEVCSLAARTAAAMSMI